jgi:hypothetical protein
VAIAAVFFNSIYFRLLPPDRDLPPELLDPELLADDRRGADRDDFTDDERPLGREDLLGERL